MKEEQFGRFKDSSIYQSKLWKKVDLSFQRLFRCFEEVKTFSTEFDCSMKVLSLLAEQLVDDDDLEDSAIISHSTKINYKQVSFCQDCQSGQHITSLFEEMYSQYNHDISGAKQTIDKNGGMLRFKCVHGKNVLTVGNSARGSFNVNRQDKQSDMQIETKVDFDKRKKSKDEAKGNTGSYIEKTNKVHFLKYNRNLFRSSESLTNLKEDNLNTKHFFGQEEPKKYISNLNNFKPLNAKKTKIDKKDKVNRYQITDKKSVKNKKNHLPRILFEINGKNQPLLQRRTSLDAQLIKKSSSESKKNNNQNLNEQNPQKHKNINLYEYRKTVSEKKIPHFEKKKTFDLQSFSRKQTIFSDKNTSKDKKLNMRMDVDKAEIMKFNLSSVFII